MSFSIRHTVLRPRCEMKLAFRYGLHGQRCKKKFCFCEPGFDPENFLQKYGIIAAFQGGLKAIQTPNCYQSEFNNADQS